LTLPHGEGPSWPAMDNLMPIGRFSSITRLSVKALRSYDESGLLRPAWVDPGSGYRYYRLSQAREAEAIRILRSLDMPISEIRELLAAPAPDVAHKLLEEHRDRLADRLADQQRMLRFLERLIEREEGAVPYEVTVKEVPPTAVLALRERVPFSDLGPRIGTAMGRLQGHLGTIGSSPAGPPLVQYHGDIVEQGEGDIDVCVPAHLSPGRHGAFVAMEIPGGTVVTTIHHGPYDEIQPAYHALGGWIQEHGHETAGPPREVYVVDPSQAEPEDLETEIAWPIRS
jgi:effector-binding domain-containing protein/DNA-binding transcriptional MerR regulator